uniref:Uncharacterized protein n=1 Tax=Steinernema glaseri TaxID=37863 RepID=A0A1I7YHA8_9BILA
MNKVEKGTTARATGMDPRRTTVIMNLLMLLPFLAVVALRSVRSRTSMSTRPREVTKAKWVTEAMATFFEACFHATPHKGEDAVVQFHSYDQVGEVAVLLGRSGHDDVEAESGEAIGEDGGDKVDSGEDHGLVGKMQE